MTIHEHCDSIRTRILLCVEPNLRRWVEIELDALEREAECRGMDKLRTALEVSRSERVLEEVWK